MKFSKLFLAFFLGAFTVSAQTYMPDDNFEAWCELHGYGDSIPNNDLISTINASFATLLPIDNVGISDLTGIEAFANLESLNCANNNLSSIDISFLGNNLTYLSVMNNPGLYCITVSDTAYAANHPAFFEDSFTSYSTNCSTAFGCMDPLSCYYEPTHSIDTAAGGSCFFSVDTNLTADVCDSYLFGGLNRYTSGTYIDVLTTVDGCDSNVILSLIIRNSTTSYDTTSVLVCDSFIWNNLLINGSGNFVFNAGLNAAGCDSTAYLTAIIEYSNTGSSTVSACDSYTWDGGIYTTSGVYINSYTNVSGCDSIHTLDLTINSSYSGVDPQVACNSFTWFGGNGNTYTASNSTATHMFQTVYGCDSLVTLNLILNNAVSSYNTQTECNSYTWIDGNTYSVTGLYIYSSTTSGGCVSVDSLDLTITNSTTSTDTQVHCDSYTWLDGITYTSSNSTATFTSINAAGCINTATLDLTIKNSTSGSLDTIVCSLYTDPLTNNYDTTAIYTFVLTNAKGCDSIVTLNLTVNYPDNSLTTITECDSYTWNGTTYTTTDIYSFNLQTVAGCDSVAVLDLFIGYNEVNTTTVTTCDNYKWLDANGNVIITPLNSDSASGGGVGNYGNSGIYIDTVHYLNQGGCDSIEILNLTLTQNIVSSSQAIDIFECGGWMGPDGIYYTTSDSQAFLVTGIAAGGCDSIQSFNINIATEKRSDENVISCDSYFWPVNGNTYTSSTLDSVVYYVTHTFPSSDTITCDSVAYLHLTINNSKYSTDTQVHCDSYIWPVNGFTYTSSNSTDSVILQTVNNCDSIVYLDLIINNSATVTTDTQVHCDSYTWIDGNTYSVSVNASSAYTNTTATYMLQTIDGCDSLIVLDLTIHPSYSDTLNPVISCDSYYWDLGTPLAAAVTYYTSGLYSVLFASQHGCDSLILLDLTIDNSHSYTDTQVHCDSYSWIDGNTYTASNSTAIYIYQTVVGGCDSIIYLDLTINYSNTGTSSVTECDSYTWDGMTYTTSGAYYNTYTNVAGCDSVHTLNLTINYSNTGTSSETECDSYTWDGMTYTTSGAYYNTYTNAAGCDSVHTLNLIIDNTVVNRDTIIACYKYTWQPALYLGSTSYWTFDTTSTFNVGVNSLTHTVYGNSINPSSVCTDISKLYLTINPLEYGSGVAVACDSYPWEGNIYDTSGVYVDTIQGSLCDSIVTLNLTINYSTSSTDNVGVHCDEYTWIDGNTYTASNNSVMYTYTNVVGCDSVVTLDLTINNSSDSIITEIACDSFYWSITDTIYYTSGAHTYTMFGGNSVGCDSTVWLYLTINNSTTSIDTQLHCDSYTWIDGITYTSSNNTATWTYPNAAGCDNLATLDLTINSSTTSIDTQLHCDSYTWIDGITYTSSNNTATWTYINAAGCDNLATLNLTITYSTSSTDSVGVHCDSYTWLDGITYTSSNNTATWTYTNAADCDSTVTLNLTINNSTTNSVDTTACNDYLWDGIVYDSTGSYTNTYTAGNGCDSSVTLNLTINNSTTNSVDATACNDYLWDGIVYDSTGSYTNVYADVNGCDSTVTLNLTINNSTTNSVDTTACNDYLWDGIVYDSTGSYTNTYTAVNGCDSIVTLTLTINISTSSIDDVGNHCDSYTWIDGVTYTTTNTTATMDYTNAAGCDSIVTLNLIINDNPVVSISSVNSNLSAITTGGTSPYAYLWTGALNSTNAIVTPIASGDYCVQVTDANGCVSLEVCENVIINAVNDLNVSKFNIYPNPTSDFVTLDFNTVIKGDYTVKIISSNGDQVYEYRILDFSGDFTKNINLSNLAKGNYIIQIHSDYQIVYRNILLQ